MPSGCFPGLPCRRLNQLDREPPPLHPGKRACEDVYTCIHIDLLDQKAARLFTADVNMIFVTRGYDLGMMFHYLSCKSVG